MNDRDRQTLGRTAHAHVAEWYRKRHPDRWLIDDTAIRFGGERFSLLTSVNVLDHRLCDPYLQIVKLVLQTLEGAAFPLEPPQSAASRRPDLADFRTREVWEVKPMSQGKQKALRQLSAFLALLRQADREYAALSRNSARYRSNLIDASEIWHPGRRLEVPSARVSAPVPGVLSFSSPQPGVILWEHEATKP
ncbi:MAG: hypothetical protein IPN34_17620 [Planctomycetes bacterium]|nr:hypothetical protein [Planctomycetota bacterium]